MSNHGWPPRLSKADNVVSYPASKVSHQPLNPKMPYPSFGCRPRGQIGHIIVAVTGFPNASRRGTKSAVARKRANSLHNTDRLRGFPNTSERRTIPIVAHKWADCLHSACCLGDPQRFRVGGGKQHSRTSGQIGYIAVTIHGFPNASKRGMKSATARKGAYWLQNTYCLGGRGPQHFRAGDKTNSGPQLKRLAT